METFQYQPLLKGDFRLLTISCDNTEGLINCTLEHVPFKIDDIDYWALSYVCNQKPLANGTMYWPETFIIVNKKKFAVKWNLWNALQHLRDLFARNIENHPLWIDAICIHQTDLEEKSHQMSMMGDIYKGALRVHAWLGEAAEESDRVMRLAIPIGDAHTRMWSKPLIDGRPLSGFLGLNPVTAEDFLDQRQKIHDSLELDEIDVAAFHRLLLRPYWERVWILQEVAMGHHVALHCGSITIPWEYFCWLCDAIDQQPFNPWDQLGFSDRPVDMDLATQIRRRVRPLHILRSQWSSLATYDQLTLLGLAQRFRDWGSTDRKDHTFALSALAYHADVEMNMPDYTMSPGAIFGRLVVTHANKYGRLDGLNFHTGDRATDLSSWIPDFSSKNKMHSLISLPSQAMEWLLAPKQLFSAAGNTKPVCEMGSRTSELSIEGIILDRIIDRGPSFPDEDFQGVATPAWQAWDSEVTRLYGRVWAPGPYKHSEDADSLYREAIERTSAADTTLTGRRREGFQVADDIDRDSMRHIFLACMWKANHGRCPVFTENGYIGLAPRDVERGDTVAILFGGQTPYILRRLWKGALSGNVKYRFVGESYIDSIMDGEALESRDIESEKVTFVLV